MARIASTFGSRQCCRRQTLQTAWRLGALSSSCASLTAGRPCQRRHVRTLVLDLDDVLVHSDWSRARGWRTFKRPGAEDFLRTMSQFYEVVVYTSQLPTYADPILDRLDPQRYIAYRHAPPVGLRHAWTRCAPGRLSVPVRPGKSCNEAPPLIRSCAGCTVIPLSTRMASTCATCPS